MRKQRESHKVAEARVAYEIPAKNAWNLVAKTRLSSKNQITIPVAICRKLDMLPGDEILLIPGSDHLWIERAPRSPEEWVEKTEGSMAHVDEWSTKEKIDAWVRAGRDERDRPWDED